MSTGSYDFYQIHSNFDEIFGCFDHFYWLFSSFICLTNCWYFLKAIKYKPEIWGKGDFENPKVRNCNCNTKSSPGSTKLVLGIWGIPVIENYIIICTLPFSTYDLVSWTHEHDFFLIESFLSFSSQISKCKSQFWITVWLRFKCALFPPIQGLPN